MLFGRNVSIETITGDNDLVKIISKKGKSVFMIE
jgi:hypothetical protein